MLRPAVKRGAEKWSRRLRTALGQAEKYSLLTWQSQSTSFSVHRLVQHIIRLSASEAERATALAEGIALIQESDPGNPLDVRSWGKLAALTPAQPAITRAIQGAAHPAAMLKALLDGYADLIQALEDKEELLNAAREAIRAHDRVADGLNKRWYRLVKTGTELTPALAAALEGIPTEPGTPAPDPTRSTM